MRRWDMVNKQGTTSTAHESMRTFSIMMSFNGHSPSMDVSEEIVKIIHGRVVEKWKDVAEATLVDRVR